MLPPPPSSTRTDTLCPYPTLFRSKAGVVTRLVDHRVQLRLHSRHRIDLPGECGNEERVHHRRGRDVELDRCVDRSEEHTSDLQSLMRISYAVFSLKQKNATVYGRERKKTRHNYRH